MAKKSFNGNCEVVLEKNGLESHRVAPNLINGKVVLRDAIKLHCLAHSFTCLGNPFSVFFLLFLLIRWKQYLDKCVRSNSMAMFFVV
ncbi:hypothetical protein T01_14171 [Trichinella spiralis]|uniref:Uncharacterized protein n=1 Tax=Trichinella spiralis TaxID=6334 RepID=A0A0V1BFE1_TRISP|nr:hypothetical protein T01_14171 [Trichinella spiralis]